MSTDVAIRNPIAIPPALQGAGVHVVEQNGVRAVVIPDTVKATHNVVQPVSEIAQADPDWSPRLSVVDLSGDQYHYTEQGKEALTKNGILLLARAAGITLEVEMLPRSVLRDQEFGFKAIATVTLSDGTLAHYPGHKKGDYDDLREEIKGTQKKWLVEKQHYPSKIETKAMLRAVSAALQLQRGGYTKQQLTKPFLIVGVSSTPADPEVRRLRALAAGNALAGRSLPTPTVEIESSQHEDPAPVAQLAPAHEVVNHVPPSAAPAQTREPNPDPEPVAGEPPADVAAAGEMVFGDGFRAKGKKVRETRSEYLQHIAFEHAPSPDQEPVVQACRKWVAWTNSQQVQP